MITIGEFASIGRVSVRMLRHYDDIGLLTPARVDPATGYRSYDRSQIGELARVLAMKDLGLRLDEITRISRGELDDAALRSLFVARRAELASQLELDSARLRRLDARIRLIEGEEIMTTITAEVKALAPVRVARIHTVLPALGPENVAPAIGPMFARLHGALEAAGVPVDGRALSLYDLDPKGFRVYAAFEVAEATAPTDEFEVVELPAVATAATTVHYGSMTSIGQAWSDLHAWLTANGYEVSGPNREVSIVTEPEPQENWVTELQQPVTRV